MSEVHQLSFYKVFSEQWVFTAYPGSELSVWTFNMLNNTDLSGVTKSRRKGINALIHTVNSTITIPLLRH